MKVKKVPISEKEELSKSYNDILFSPIHSKENINAAFKFPQVTRSCNTCLERTIMNSKVPGSIIHCFPYNN